jgi:DnaJ-class molecular chaperone
MQKKNYYEIFRLYPPIDPRQLQDTYRQLVFEHHPDRNPDRREWAIERTMEIVEAYNVLSDPARRDAYNFEIRNDIHRDPGENHGVKRSLLKMGKTREETEGAAHFSRGVEYFGDRDTWNQALHEWGQALKQLPGLANAYYNMGILFGYQGNFKDAMAAFDHALRLNPGDADAKKAKNMAMGYVYGKKAE